MSSRCLNLSKQIISRKHHLVTTLRTVKYKTTLSCLKILNRAVITQKITYYQLKDKLKEK